MWLTIFSLLGIFLENSIFFSGEKVFLISLPFFTYTLLKKNENGIFVLILVMLLISLQGGRYLEFFLSFFLYSCVCYFLFRHMEYNQGTIFHVTILELIFYGILRYSAWNIYYFVIHGLIFFLLNYIYLKECYKE